jgi:hypothetical protein
MDGTTAPKRGDQLVEATWTNFGLLFRTNRLTSAGGGRITFCKDYGWYKFNAVFLTCFLIRGKGKTLVSSCQMNLQGVGELQDANGEKVAGSKLWMDIYRRRLVEMVYKPVVKDEYGNPVKGNEILQRDPLLFDSTRPMKVEFYLETKCLHIRCRGLAKRVRAGENLLIIDFVELHEDHKFLVNPSWYKIHA